MPFPSNYKNVTSGSNYSYQKMKPGGHKCKVLTMSTRASSNGNKMIEITFDTTMDDTQPNFYVNSDYKGKYSCVVDDRVLDRNGNPYGLTNLKRLMTSFEDSNEGFKIVDDNYGVNDPIFCQQFIGKKIGFIMGEEEYEKDGSIKTMCRAKYPCGYDGAFERKAPAKKCIERSAENVFIDVSLDDSSLPFN